MIIQTKSPTLFVGDIHGNYILLEKTLNFAEKHGYNYIQLGDLLDSFIFFNQEQVRCLEIAYEAQKKDNVYFLKGNHELSYLVPIYYQCSGYSKNRQKLFYPILKKLKLYDYLILDNILITHAGLSKNFLANNRVTSLEITLEDIPAILSHWLENPFHPIYRAGYDSGGSELVGGIYWCRPENFRQVSNFIQIFGHTFSPLMEYNHKHKYWNVDTLQHKKEILLYEDGEFEIIPHAYYI